jgi:threonine dehydrogenase-like Zn-dependent dehydrogenase
VHAALRAGVTEGDIVVVLGAGTLGLLTIAALRHCTAAGTVIAVGKHPVQRDWARTLGADLVTGPDEMPRLVRRRSGSMAYGTQLTGGADAVLDCVGSADSIQQSLAVIKPRGRVTLVGMPATVKLELTTLWHRETELAGAYAYGTEQLADGSRRRTFDLAFELVAAADLGRLVSATYPLAEYPAAIEHAANAGRRGGVKVAFDLRAEKERDR